MKKADPTIMAIGQAYKNYDIVERLDKRIEELKGLSKKWDVEGQLNIKPLIKELKEIRKGKK